MNLKRALAWGLCLIIVHGLFVLSGHPLRDPDSSLYEEIARSLEAQPLSTWMVPHWPEGRIKSGVFREHFAVFFWPASLLGRLGIPRPALLLNAAVFLLLLGILFRWTRQLADVPTAWLAVWLFILSPLGLQYLVRFNHEPAWAVMSLIALEGLWRLGRGEAAGASIPLGIIGAFLMKGVLGLGVLVGLGGLWWVCGRPKKALPLVAAGIFGCLLVGAAYEWAFRALAHESFWASYVGAQVGYVQRAEGFGVGAKLLNPLYYLVSTLWFALPGVLGWLVARTSAQRGEAPPREVERLVLASWGPWLLAVSVMTRRAVRYLFPAYPLWSILGAVGWARWVPTLHQRLANKVTALPYVTMALLVLIALLRALVARYAHHSINVLEGTRALPP